MQLFLRSILFILACSTVFYSCRNRKSELDEKTVFRYNEPSGITSLDPAYAKDQANIWACNQIYDGLVRLDSSLKPSPAIAKSWEVSENGLEYTFILRNDVYFHNADNFTSRRVIAGDFVFSFSRIIDPDVASPGSWIFDKVKRKDGEPLFTANGDTILKIILREPFPPLLGILSMQYCAVIPEEAFRNPDRDFKRNPVGTGPFKLGYWKDGIKLVLVRNENYFELIGKESLPFLDAVAISFLSDQQSAFLEFIKGNLDFLSGIDPSYKDELLTKTGELNPMYSDRVNLIKGPYLNTEYLGIFLGGNQNEGNPLLKKEVRQAINMGFDRQKMIRYLRNGIGIPGEKGIIPAGMPAFDTAGPSYTYMPDSARRLLEKTGYYKDDDKEALILHTTAEYLDICKFMQSQLSEIGMAINVEVHPAAAIKEMKANGKLDLFRASWIADYPDEENYLSLFYSGNFVPGGPNYTHFKNEEYDNLYLNSQKLIDENKRVEAYRSMNRIIFEEAPVVVLYYDQVTRFTSKDVTGMRGDPRNLLDLRMVRKKK